MGRGSVVPASQRGSVRRHHSASAGHSRGRWNHNIHYHPLVLGALPQDAHSALDVGTGDGLLAIELCAVVENVTAIDIDADVLAAAESGADGVTWVCDDVMTHDFQRHFDAVVSIATMHHLPDLGAALRRLAELTSPGGVVVVIGLARSSTLSDYLMDAVGLIWNRWLSWRRGYWEHSALTVWPPPQTYSQVRQRVASELPGAHYQRLALFRYAVTWEKQ